MMVLVQFHTKFSPTLRVEDLSLKVVGSCRMDSSQLNSNQTTCQYAWIQIAQSRLKVSSLTRLDFLEVHCRLQRQHQI